MFHETNDNLSHNVFAITKKKKNNEIVSTIFLYLNKIYLNPPAFLREFQIEIVSKKDFKFVYEKNMLIMIYAGVYIILRRHLYFSHARK